MLTPTLNARTVQRQILNARRDTPCEWLLYFLRFHSLVVGIKTSETRRLAGGTWDTELTRFDGSGLGRTSSVGGRMDLA